MEAQQSRTIWYKLVCERNVFCYHDVRSYVYKAYYPKSLPFAFQHLKFIEWCSLCSAVCCCRLHPSLLLTPLNFKPTFFTPEDFSVSNLPLRGLTIWRSCVCCSVCMRNSLRFTDSKHCFTDDEKTAHRECFGHWWEFEIAFSRMLHKNKNAPWCQLLYDVMADTIGYIQVKMRAVSLQLARTHAWFTHCARASCTTRL